MSDIENREGVDPVVSVRGALPGAACDLPDPADVDWTEGRFWLVRLKTQYFYWVAEKGFGGWYVAGLPGCYSNDGIEIVAELLPDRELEKFSDD